MVATGCVPRWLGAGGAGLVLQYSDLLQGDQAVADHLFEDGLEALDVLLGVYDLDDQRQIPRELEQVCRMHDTARAEAGQPAQHGGARETFPAQALDERIGQRSPVPAVALADEDADHPLLAFEDA